MVIFPSHEDGIPFLKKYQAWGYIKMKRKPEFFALHVGKPISKVVFFAKIERITEPLSSKDQLEEIEDDDKNWFMPGRQVVYLKKGSLVNLRDPIPASVPGGAFQGLAYTNIEKFKKARDTKELFEGRLTW